MNKYVEAEILNHSKLRHPHVIQFKAGEQYLRGSAAGPQVTLSASSFNFGNVPAGQVPSRVLYMQVQSVVYMPIRRGSTEWDG